MHTTDKLSNQRIFNPQAERFGVMYAIITDGGRQYRIEEGQELDVDYRDVAAGTQLQFDKILAIAGDGGLTLGQPLISGAKVLAEVVGLEMGEKIFVQKFLRRKNYRRRTGHRQMFTRVKINKIQA
jgi:large subunit ribosomal protein L21